MSEEKGFIINTSIALLNRVLYKPGVSVAVAKGNVPSKNSNVYSGIPAGQPKDTPLYQSVLNTPVMSNLDIKGGAYTDNNNKPQTYPDITIDTVIFIVEQNKHIVKTAINGVDGEVKEFISNGDYKITIEGVINGLNGKHPFDDVAALERVLKSPVPLQINSYYLQNIGITNIVIESYTIPQVQGGYSYQTFKINALSDLPVELFITQ